MFGRGATPAPLPAVPEDESPTAKFSRLNAEADREQTGHAARRSANNARATTLIGAASIGASVSGGSHGLLNVGAGVMFLVTAILGVVTLWPKRGPGVALGPLFDRLYVTSSEAIELTLLQVKLKVLADDEDSLGRAAVLVRVGFIFIALAILLLAAHAGAALTPWKKVL